MPWGVTLPRISWGQFNPLKCYAQPRPPVPKNSLGTPSWHNVFRPPDAPSLFVVTCPHVGRSRFLANHRGIVGGSRVRDGSVLHREASLHQAVGRPEELRAKPVNYIP